jgi:hypothetical protein
VTFGTPPITTTPLSPFDDSSVFLSFVNEGDLIPRSDRPYINSLLQLNITRAPSVPAKWSLPARTYVNAGNVVLIPRYDEGLKRPKEWGEGSLAQTLMGNPKAHKMHEYLERLSGLR